MGSLLKSIAALPHLGETLSAASALVWAVAVILFRICGRTVPALAMSLFKNILAGLLLLLTLAALGLPLLPPLPFKNYALMFLSGVVGIAISDTLFFVALNKLGAELTAIVDCAYAPFVIGLSFLFLDERINPDQSGGVVLIVGAVLLISGRRGEAQIPRRDLRTGIALGILSMFISAGGVVIMKPLLAEDSLVWAGLVRTVGGAVSIALVLAFHPKRRAILAPLASGRTLALLVPAAVLSAYISMVLWMGGMKYTQASIASALNQLNTIFIFILAAVFLKEKITPSKLTAVALAFAGAMLVSIPFK
jgi:drug/metabolite transporter (DMT)-like permease